MLCKGEENVIMVCIYKRNGSTEMNKTTDSLDTNCKTWEGWRKNTVV